MAAAYLEDFIDIELTSGSLYRSFLNRPIGEGDIKANRFGIRIYRNGEAVNIGSSSVQGYFMAPDGSNIAITDSSHTGISGNTAWIDLPQACYNYEGQFTLAIKVIGDGVTGTMRIVDGVVNNTGVTGAVAPTGTVPTYQEVLAVYEEMLEAKAGAIRYDIEQELSNAQKAQARDNIGMVEIEFVHIEDDEYLMDVSTECEFVNTQGNEYTLVLHAD